jgi:hypothetical protein
MLYCSSLQDVLSLTYLFIWTRLVSGAEFSALIGKEAMTFPMLPTLIPPYESHLNTAQTLNNLPRSSDIGFFTITRNIIIILFNILDKLSLRRLRGIQPGCAR